LKIAQIQEAEGSVGYFSAWCRSLQLPSTQRQSSIAPTSHVLHCQRNCSLFISGAGSSDTRISKGLLYSRSTPRGGCRLCGTLPTLPGSVTLILVKLHFLSPFSHLRQKTICCWSPPAAVGRITTSQRNSNSPVDFIKVAADVATAGGGGGGRPFISPPAFVTCPYR
jgi:hypothetical protein